MTLSRRDFIKLAGLVAGSAAVSSCAPLYGQLADISRDSHLSPTGEKGIGANEWTLLNRLTFGPRPEERASVAAIGIQGWIEEQLAPDSLDDFDCNLRLAQFDTLGLSANDLYDISDKIFENQDRLRVPGELRQAALVRQIYSRRQLFERMVDFWSDHFNISVEKGDCFYLKTVDDREVVRPHALGSFRELLWASAHSPAMLTYLDNQSNVKGTPNENYARELMELHTLGVNGGYSQGDVMELARCLTGWTVKEHFWRGAFTFDPGLHDNGPKTVLGMAIRPGAADEAEGVLERLAAHPATARFVALKLARRFVSETPPEELVARAAQAFLQTRGEVRAVLRVLLLDGTDAVAPKFKRPGDYLVSSLRMSAASSDAGAALQNHLARMGQPYFRWPTPDGFPDRSDRWQGTLMPRWQFALALLRNEIEGTRVKLSDLSSAEASEGIESSLDRLGPLLLGAALPASQRDSLAAALREAGAKDEPETASILAAGLIASPAFQWH